MLAELSKAFFKKDNIDIMIYQFFFPYGGKGDFHRFRYLNLARTKYCFHTLLLQK